MTDPTGGLVETIQGLYALAEKAGPFGTGLMFWMWLRADNERKASLKDKEASAKEYLRTMYETKETLRDLNELFKGRSNGG